MRETNEEQKDKPVEATPMPEPPTVDPNRQLTAGEIQKQMQDLNFQYKALISQKTKKAQELAILDEQIAKCIGEYTALKKLLGEVPVKEDGKKDGDCGCHKKQ